jgi:8-oxo-dGTP diphosphatase
MPGGATGVPFGPAGSQFGSDEHRPCETGGMDSPVAPNTSPANTRNSRPGEAESREVPLELRRPLGPRDPGDAWVEGDRGRFWGRFGSAGLLVHDAAKGVLLQHRALWSDKGGTWGLPGGALHQGEEAVHGALREAEEEAAVPPANVRVLFTSVFDVGYWTYTTVAAEVVEAFDPVISDPESLELQWVPVDLVDDKDLHPGFGAAWPALRSRLQGLDAGPDRGVDPVSGGS